MRVVEAMQSNINYNWQTAGGKPYGWDESKYGSWAGIVQRNAGRTSFNASDTAILVQWLMNDYQPQPGDWFEINFGPMPQASPTDWTIHPEYYATYMAEMQAAEKSEMERQYKLYQAELELAEARARASRSGSSGGSSGGSVRVSGGGGGGGSSGSDDWYYQAKLDMDWKIALLQAEGRLAELEQQERIALMEIESRERMQQREIEYMQQRDLENLRTQRGEMVVRTMANPNDALQREYMLRMFNNMANGQEPKGTAVDIFTGQTLNNGKPMSLTEIQDMNAQNWGVTAITTGNPQAATAPVPGPTTNPHPPQFARGTVPTLEELLARVDRRTGSPAGATEESPAEPAWPKVVNESWIARILRQKKNKNLSRGASMKRKKPFARSAAYAEGTQDYDGLEFTHTTEPFFIVGDSVDGKPTGYEELIINHDRGRVTVIPNRLFSHAIRAIENGRVRYAT